MIKADEAMNLAVPLSMTQIEAAKSIHGRLEQWAATDRALYLLRDRFPGFDADATLLKVAAVNQLYFTNVYAVPRMAHHIMEVMSGDVAAIPPHTLVERIAALPKTAAQKSDRKHTSFAAKFAHFFIDSERFPIYDSYAEQMVEYHLGKGATVKDADHPYQVFIKNLGILKHRARLTCTDRELDQYLWLAGLYRAWKRSKKAPINADVARMLESATPEAVAEFVLMFPPEV